MHAKNTTHTNKHRGQSLVEFALTLPLLLLLILGAMDFARMFTTKILVTNAAREGANYLSQNPEQIQNAREASKNEAPNLNLLDQDITPYCSETVDGECKQVTVEVTNSMNLIFSGFLQFMGVSTGPFNISSTVRMMVR